MNVLVAGGAGYIGSVMTEALLAAGLRAVVYDNRSHGHRGAVAGGAARVEGDVGDSAAEERAACRRATAAASAWPGSPQSATLAA